MVNKKILGMPLTMLVIGLLMVGGVSAALVAYLSNEVSATVSVEDSPLELYLVEGHKTQFAQVTGTSVDFGDVKGGSVLKMTQRLHNPGTVDVTNNVLSVVEQTAGGYFDATDECGEFEYIIARTSQNGVDWDGWHNVSCVRISPTHVELSYGSSNDIPAGYQDLTQVEIKLALNAVGTYEYTNQFMVD